MLPVSILIYDYICRIKHIKMDIGERTKVGLLVIAGVVCGLGGLFMYLLRAHTYFVGDNPSACVNCHIMTLKHTAYFVGRMEHQAIKAETLTGQVVMDNCIRCHEQLNTEFVKTGRMGYMTQQAQGGKVCWDCHRNVPHGGMNSLMATPNAEGVTPLPPSPVPEWLQKMMN